MMKSTPFHKQFTVKNSRRLVAAVVRFCRKVDVFVASSLGGRRARTAEEEERAQTRGVLVLAAVSVLAIGAHILAHFSLYFGNR